MIILETIFVHCVYSTGALLFYHSKGRVNVFLGLAHKSKFNSQGTVDTRVMSAGFLQYIGPSQKLWASIFAKTKLSKCHIMLSRSIGDVWNTTNMFIFMYSIIVIWIISLDIFPFLDDCLNPLAPSAHLRVVLFALITAIITTKLYFLRSWVDAGKRLGKLVPGYVLIAGNSTRAPRREWVLSKRCDAILQANERLINAEFQSHHREIDELLKYYDLANFWGNSSKSAVGRTCMKWRTMRIKGRPEKEAWKLENYG